MGGLAGSLCFLFFQLHKPTAQLVVSENTNCSSGADHQIQLLSTKLTAAQNPQHSIKDGKEIMCSYNPKTRKGSSEIVELAHEVF